MNDKDKDKDIDRDREDETEIESPSEWKIRTRSQLDSWAPAVALLLVLLALAGGWLTYTAYAVEEEPEERTVVASEWSTDPGFSHAAVVERPNPLYEVGETVSGTPAYYTRVMPTLSGSYVFGYRASESGSLDVGTEVEMVMRETGGDGAVYWSQTDTLAETTAEGVEPGQRVTSSFTVNVTEVRSRIEGIRSGLGSTVGTGEVLLVFTTNVEGEVNGEEVNTGERNRITLGMEGDVYRVDIGEGGMQGRSFQTNETVEVEPEPDRTRMVLSPLLLLVSFGSLVGLTVAKHKDIIAPTERQLLAMERQEFDEWISTGILAEDILKNGRSVVRVDSVEGVVDIAIDCGGRAIEDREEGTICVVDESVVYLYEYDEDIRSRLDGDEDVGRRGNGADENEGGEEGAKGETAAEPHGDGEGDAAGDADERDEGDIDLFGG